MGAIGAMAIAGVATAGISAATAGSNKPKVAGDTTSTSVSAPWSAQQPYLKDVFWDAQGLAGGDPATKALLQKGSQQYYPDGTVAPQSPYTQQSIGLEAQRGMDGSPVTDAASASTVAGLDPSALSANPGNNMYQGVNGSANRYLGGIAAGDQLHGDPFLQNQWDAMRGDITNSYQTAVAPGIDATYEGAGRFGSGAAAMGRGLGQQALAGQLAGAGANLLSNNYQAAAGRQLGAANTLLQTGLNTAQGTSSNYDNAATNQTRLAGLAPSLAATDYQNIAAVNDAGAQQDAYSQNLINADKAKWDFQQQAPWNTLAAYSGLVNGNYGGTTTSTQPYFSSGGSALQGALGGAMSGATLGANLYGLYGK